MYDVVRPNTMRVNDNYEGPKHHREFEFPKIAELHLLTHCSPVGALCLVIATPAKFLTSY